MAAPWTARERDVLARLGRPDAIQAFLDGLGYNKETGGETFRSTRRVLRDRVAHCTEGALLAASALRFHGRRPLVLLLRAVRDDDHVLALFRERRESGAWGAVAKSNYAGLRFREPVYRTLRELVMSYFEHYYNPDAERTLRVASRPIDLARLDRLAWETSEEDLWPLNDAFYAAPARPLLTPAQARRLGRLDRRLYEAGFHGAVGVAPLPARAGHRRAAR